MFKKIPLNMINLTPLKKVIDTFSEGVIPVFMVHRIEDIERGVEGISPAEIDHFLYKMHQNNYEFIGLEEFCMHLEKPGRNTKNKALFTMDDGYLDQIEKGVPVFQKHDCPISIALITDFISGKIWPWDEKIRYIFEMSNSKKINFSLSQGGMIEYEMGNRHARFKVMREIRENLKKQPEEIVLKSVVNLAQLLEVEIPEKPPESCKSFGWDDVEKLEGEGVNFIPHTRTHIILSNLTVQRAKEEIEGSIADVKEHIDPVPVFIYPNGRHRDYNSSHIKILHDNGIKAAFSTEHAYLHLYEFDQCSNERFNIPRISFPEGLDQYKILSHLDCIRERYLRNSFRDLFEIIYGTKRLALSHFVNVVFRGRYYRKYRNFEVSKIRRIVFVCKGNICRSPFAEVIALAKKIRLPVVSMGFAASGCDKPEQSAIKIAKEFGYDMNALCSTRLKDSLIKDGDLIVVMEISHLNAVRKLALSANYQMTLLGLWNEEPMLSIFDPYGRSEARFRYLFSHINTSVKNIIEYISARC